MARPIENLSADHLSIVEAVRALDRLISATALGARPFEAWAAAHQFLARFADGAHYAKEELLFAEVSASRLPCVAMPGACLSMEHDATRAQTNRISAAVQAIGGGDDSHWASLLDAAARYAGIIWVH